MSESKNPQFADFDALLDASMDDIADLPPVGVPPTGSYMLEVTASREEGKDGKNDYIQFEYEVREVNELKYEEDEAEGAKAGQKFTVFFSPFKKDGTVNDMGLGYLKKELEPYAAHFGTKGIGESIAAVNKVLISASIIRVQDKKDETRFNCRMKDVVIQ